MMGATTLKGRDTYGELEKVRPEGFPENGCSAYVGALFSPGGFHALWRTGGQLMGSVRLAAAILRNLCFAPGCTEGVLPMRGEENGRNVRRHAPPAVTVWTEGVTSLFQGFPAQAKQI